MTIKTQVEIDTARMVRATKRVIKTTSQGKLAALQADRLKWQRRATIASNKLAAAQRAIETFADDMAAQLLDHELK
jgi:hypothetical protein